MDDDWIGNWNLVVLGIVWDNSFLIIAAPKWQQG
jgi:hypothetical protein